MSAFPKLKTGAVAQYPASRAAAYATEVFRFLDGSDQRYRAQGAPVRRWAIRLELLDESEMAALEAFFEATQGRCGSFSFEDPWDGSVHADCSLESDEAVFELTGEARGKTALVVSENRS
jgi:hypothetical protein